MTHSVTLERLIVEREPAPDGWGVFEATGRVDMSCVCGWRAMVDHSDAQRVAEAHVEQAARDEWRIRWRNYE